MHVKLRADATVHEPPAPPEAAAAVVGNGFSVLPGNRAPLPSPAG